MNIQPHWLGITEQQFNIFKIVYELNLKNRSSKAKDILTEYSNQFHSIPKRQNLFNQLKVLMERKLIERNKEFSYLIISSNLQDILKKNREIQEKELNEFSEFLVNFKTGLNSLIQLPKASYLNPDRYMETVSSFINNSEVMYADSPFPNISYSQSFYKLLNRKEFIESMKLNCFKLKKLKIFYLTSMVIDLSFRRCMKLFNSPTIAYRECGHAINRLEKQVNIFPNFEIRHLPILPGPHMYIFENSEPKDIILSLRGSNVAPGIEEQKGFPDPYGGIHILSSKVAIETKKLFMNNFDQATPLKGKKGKPLFDQARKRLDELYSQCYPTNGKKPSKEHLSIAYIPKP